MDTKQDAELCFINMREDRTRIIQYRRPLNNAEVEAMILCAVRNLQITRWASVSTVPPQSQIQPTADVVITELVA